MCWPTCWSTGHAALADIPASQRLVHGRCTTTQAVTLWVAAFLLTGVSAPWRSHWWSVIPELVCRMRNRYGVNRIKTLFFIQPILKLQGEIHEACLPAKRLSLQGFLVEGSSNLRFCQVFLVDGRPVENCAGGKLGDMLEGNLASCSDTDGATIGRYKNKDNR